MKLPSKPYLVLWVLVLAVAVFTSFILFERRAPMTTPIVTLALNLSADNFAQALGKERGINKQPAGLNFHDRDWPFRAPGKVRFVHGPHSFDIDLVLTVMGTEDVERPAFGIEKFFVHRGLKSDDLMPHDEARYLTMAFLQQLMALGWRPYYFTSEARLKGKSSWSDTDDRDPRYTPTFEEWMGNISQHWKLEANGVYLRVSIERAFETDDPLKPGAYLMTVELRTELNVVRLWFPEEKRDNWQEFWPDMAITDKEQRAKEEAQARAKGLEIDTDYRDARIIALEGPVITAKVGAPCVKAGWWEASLPASHRNAKALAKAPSRWRLLKAGEAMPYVYSAELFGASAAADNAAVVWTWQREGE